MDLSRGHFVGRGGLGMNCNGVKFLVQQGGRIGGGCGGIDGMNLGEKFSKDGLAMTDFLEKIDLEHSDFIHHKDLEEFGKLSRKIFVNRNLRLDKIKYIGFDMDFTLAIYKDHGFERLTYQETLRRLVEDMGYPREILKFRYDPEMVIRGLVMDRSTGAVFKPDSHRYVGRAMLYRRMLSKEKRRQFYGTRKINLGGEDYRWLDTLFEIPEAAIYTQLLEFLELRNLRHRFPWGKVFEDLRVCMDASHADPRVKDRITCEPERYIERDSLLGFALHRFRSVGIRLFLLTNSSWEYTDKVMRYLLEGEGSRYSSWMQYFDWIIVGAQKPFFFRSNRSFIRQKDLDHLDSSLSQKVWVGGSLQELRRRFNIVGDQVLYIGDHIYGDILRSKKDTLWRTCMIIPELEREIELSLLHRDLFYRERCLEEKRLRLDEEMNYHRLIKRKLNLRRREEDSFHSLWEKNNRALVQLQRELRLCLEELDGVERELDRIFNSFWGSLFREGNEKSLFGHQVENYACLYTSRVSNFAFYSPLQYFRASGDRMPHEMFF